MNIKQLTAALNNNETVYKTSYPVPVEGKVQKVDAKRVRSGYSGGESVLHKVLVEGRELLLKSREILTKEEGEALIEAYHRKQKQAAEIREARRVKADGMEAMVARLQEAGCRVDCRNGRIVLCDFLGQDQPITFTKATPELEAVLLAHLPRV